MEETPPDPIAPIPAEEPAPNVVNGLATRMPDGGPRYQETPLDPYAIDAAAIAEPYNTVTAALFIFIAIIWAIRVLRAGIHRHPFVAVCLPILLAGGIGGTLYHAYRTRVTYFLLDVIPISLLGLAGSIYLLIRIGKKAGARQLILYSVGAISIYLALNGLIFRGLLKGFLAQHPHLTVNLSYASLALIIMIPLVIVLIRTRFRHGSLIVAGLLSFAIAWFCRLVDGTGLVDLSMGTHWLWHTFGAITTAFVFEYFFRLEREEI